MKQKVSYPTDFDNYDDLLEATYGDFDKVELIIPSLDDPAIVKRFCTVFPNTASLEAQKLSMVAEDNLLLALGQEFANAILPYSLHMGLYHAKTLDEIRVITNTIKLALKKGEWDKDPKPLPEDFSEDFKNDYKKILMPFIHTPIPPQLIEKVELELDKLEKEMGKYMNPQSQVHPADLFAINVSVIIKEYFIGLLDTILSIYPQFTDRGAPSSVWSHIKTIKRHHKIQNYIQILPESQYIVELSLLKIFSQKAISIKDFLNLKLEAALEYQNQAEQTSIITSQKESATTKLIKWNRKKEFLKTFWEVLSENGYIDSEVSFPFLSSHFRFTRRQSEIHKDYQIDKIVWLSSNKNLLHMTEKLSSNGIIKINQFGKQTTSSQFACINNLIHEHFCGPNNKSISLDAIKKTKQRQEKGNPSIDTKFVCIIYKLVRLIAQND